MLVCVETGVVQSFQCLQNLMIVCWCVACLAVSNVLLLQLVCHA
jgi:hypothetical protein